jgi:solute carrier family 39 (zinc transporter), member 1/2/3
MKHIALLSSIIILTVTLLAGFFPFLKKSLSNKPYQSAIGEALAAGVFLGAGLLHMLNDATQSFAALHYHYPIALLLTGAAFLFFLLLEHIGKDLYHHGSNNTFAILSFIMLSIHSFLAGTALGVSGETLVAVVILFAIIAHKWAASFALAVQITKSDFSFKAGLSLFIIFALMAPLGIAFGSSAITHLAQYPLLEPIFLSIASGTFLYLGTLHGLERAVLVKDCCNLKTFSFVIVGFAIMAVVAIWT